MKFLCSNLIEDVKAINRQYLTQDIPTISQASLRQSFQIKFMPDQCTMIIKIIFNDMTLIPLLLILLDGQENRLMINCLTCLLINCTILLLGRYIT